MYHSGSMGIKEWSFGNPHPWIREYIIDLLWRDD